MLKVKNTQMIDLSDWDDLVTETYHKPYSFQQQDGCKYRGTHHIDIPGPADDYQNDTVPEEINGEEMGVSLAAWLARDVEEWNGAPEDSHFIDTFWERNFYPHVQAIANDLQARGLIPAGKYAIEIDW